MLILFTEHASTHLRCKNRSISLNALSLGSIVAFSLPELVCHFDAGWQHLNHVPLCGY